MKIVLKKNHERNGELFLEGEEIEVTKEEYDFIMSCYIAERKAQIEELERVESEVLPSKKGKK